MEAEIMEQVRYDAGTTRKVQDGPARSLTEMPPEQRMPALSLLIVEDLVAWREIKRFRAFAPVFADVVLEGPVEGGVVHQIVLYRVRRCVTEPLEVVTMKNQADGNTVEV